MSSYSVRRGSLPTYVRAVGMAERLGAEARRAREEAGLTMMQIAVAAGVSHSTVQLFETGAGWRRQTDQLVRAYEDECGLPRDEIWRRALAG